MDRFGGWKPQYSGKRSDEFWNAVNALPDPSHTVMYIFGCALQDLESRVLQALVAAQEMEKERDGG